MFEDVEFRLDTSGEGERWHCTGSGSDVACHPRARDRISPYTIVHELGHTFNARLVNHLNDEIRVMQGI